MTQWNTGVNSYLKISVVIVDINIYVVVTFIIIFERRRKQMIKYNHAITKRLLNKKVDDESLLKWILTLLKLDINSLTKVQYEELETAFHKQGVYLGTDIEGEHIFLEIGDVLIKLHRWIDDFIPGNGKRGHCEFLIDLGTIDLVRESDGSVYKLFSSGSRQTQFILRFSDILSKFGSSLSRCQECNTVFLKTKRQEYCSKQCSQKMRTRRYFISHIEEHKQKLSKTDARN